MSRTSARGFGLVEATIAAVIAGGVIVVAINTITAATVIKHKAADRERANLLAVDLITEALRNPYKDLVTGTGATPGPGSDEDIGNRSLFDDVDDYHGWSASPPQEKSGAVMTHLHGWRRTASIRRLDPTTLATSSSDTGVLEVTVVVERHGVEVARAVAIRTESWETP